MGSSRWSDEHYVANNNRRLLNAEPLFAHNHACISSGVNAAHKKLNPLNIIRESRDSTEHPESHAVAVFLDVTGSMNVVPETVQKNLPGLMGLLLRRSFMKDPAIMVGAVGDATCDQVPLQVGQFESGIEIENDLTNLVLEGGGGGQNTESYELAAYFLARHTKIDCFEKRQKKGFAFFIGDERFYPAVSAMQVRHIIGDSLQEDIPTDLIFSELQTRYEVFFIMPKLTAHYGEEKILKPWKALLGQHVLLLDDAAGICELIASTIGLVDGTVTNVEDDLTAAGVSVNVARSVSTSLANITNRGSDLAVASSGGPSGLSRV